MKLFLRLLPVIVTTVIICSFLWVIRELEWAFTIWLAGIAVGLWVTPTVEEKHTWILKCQIWASETWSNLRGPVIPAHEGWDENTLTSTLERPADFGSRDGKLYSKLRDPETEAWYARHEAIDAELRATWARQVNDFRNWGQELIDEFRNNCDNAHARVMALG